VEKGAYPRERMSRRFAVAVSLISLAALFLCDPATARWRPPPTTAPWQWQLQGRIDTGIEAPVYDVDGFETPGVSCGACTTGAGASSATSMSAAGRATGPMRTHSPVR